MYFPKKKDESLAESIFAGIDEYFENMSAFQGVPSAALMLFSILISLGLHLEAITKVGYFPHLAVIGVFAVVTVIPAIITANLVPGAFNEFLGRRGIDPFKGMPGFRFEEDYNYGNVPKDEEPRGRWVPTIWTSMYFLTTVFVASAYVINLMIHMVRLFFTTYGGLHTILGAVIFLWVAYSAYLITTYVIRKAKS